MKGKDWNSIHNGHLLPLSDKKLNPSQKHRYKAAVKAFSMLSASHFHKKSHVESTLEKETDNSLSKIQYILNQLTHFDYKVQKRKEEENVV